MSGYATYKTIGKKENENENENLQQNLVIEINSAEDRINACKNYPAVIIDYYTNWCIPCKRAIIPYRKLAEKYKESGILFMKEDAEKDFTNRPNVSAVPSFHFYLNGKLQEELTCSGGNMDDIEINIQKLKK